MNIKERERVRQAATVMRLILERHAPKLRSPGLIEFPRGACDDTSFLLGERLRSLGLGDWTHRHGSLDCQTHAWIEREGVILDITADQFPDVTETVILTSDSTWHDQFSPTQVPHTLANLDSYDGLFLTDLRADYETLLAALSDGTLF